MPKTQPLLTKMLSNILFRVVQGFLICIYFNLPITNTEIAFIRGLISINVSHDTIVTLSGEKDHGSPLQYARAACGDLCDSSRQQEPWRFLNYTVADVKKPLRK